MTRAGKEILPYSQKALTWVRSACQLQGRVAFFAPLIWWQIRNNMNRFPVHPEHFLPLCCLLSEAWAQVCCQVQERRDPAPSPASISTHLGKRTAVAVQHLLHICLGWGETKCFCFAKQQCTALDFIQHLLIFKLSCMFTLSGGEPQKIQYYTRSRNFKLTLVDSLLQALKISLSPLIGSGSGRY